MSSHINSLLRSDKDSHNRLSLETDSRNEIKSSEYLCVIENCGSSFKDALELKEHLNKHLEN